MTTIVDGVEIEVEYKYYPPCRGARGSYGEPLEPDEPETSQTPLEAKTSSAFW